MEEITQFIVENQQIFWYISAFFVFLYFTKFFVKLIKTLLDCRRGLKLK